jgi:hypothetical protein
MMLRALLARLRSEDVRLAPDGDHLIVDAPKGLLTPTLKDTLLHHKAALLSLLQEDAPTAEITPADLPADWRVEWEELAANRESETGKAKEHAEAEALHDIIVRMRGAS